MKHNIITQPTNVLTSTGTAVVGSVPVDSSGQVPRIIRVSATAAGYFRLSLKGTAATKNDALIQPGDAVQMMTSGCEWASFISETGTAKCVIAAEEFGPISNYTSFDPVTFFAASEVGAWYDPSDLSTLYQDSAGTTPVTAVEQPVGLMRDKSGRGNHATQPTAASRPVLSARVNLLIGTETLATQSVTTLATNYTLSFSGTGSVTLSGTATGTYSAGTRAITCTAGTLTITVSGSVTQADLRVTNTGVNLPPYQRVNTATDYDTTGFPYYLKFNGSNSSMSTGSIDFTSTAQMTVVAGVRKLSDAALGIATELSANTDVNAGAFYIAAPFGTTTSGDYAFKSVGTVFPAPARSSTILAPITSVLSGIGSISGSQSILRINGSQAASVTSSQGTGNYGNYPLYIGARGGSSLYFNGQLYGLVVRGAVSSDAQIIAAERYMNGKVKAY